MPRLPQRIVCLTTETVEVLYAIGDINKILAVQPDLVFSFSNLQADIASELIKAGVPVHAFNQRSVDDILAMIETVGRLVGAEAKALELVTGLEELIKDTQAAAAALPRRPKVYFEEWDDPPISSIRWVSEMIGIAGGDDIFSEAATRQSAKERIIADPLEIARRAPDIIIGSWCGKKFRPEKVAARQGWADVPAIAGGQLHEIKSAVILNPGPVAIREGLPALARLIQSWAASA